MQYGLIAEEVAKVFPNLVIRDKHGKPLTVAYQQLPPLLLAQAQREHARVTRQQRQLNQQKRQLDRLTALVHRMSRLALNVLPRGRRQSPRRVSRPP